MFSIETLYLFGNPVVNQCPQLASVDKNQNQLKRNLQQYFGLSGNQGLASSSLMGLSTMAVGGSPQRQSHSLNDTSNFQVKPQFGDRLGVQSNLNVGPKSGFQLSTGSVYGGTPQSSPGHLADASPGLKPSDAGEVLQLKKKITILEQENSALKLKVEASNPSTLHRQATHQAHPGVEEDRNWMSSFGSAPRLGGVERPQTASA